MSTAYFLSEVDGSKYGGVGGWMERWMQDGTNALRIV